jgi:hypothetical protein
LEASSGYIRIVQNDLILQNPKEDHCNYCDNSRNHTSLTYTHNSNKGRQMKTSHHTKTQQATAIESATEMEKHKREDHRDASNQTTNTTHHILYQDEATPNGTEHSRQHQDEEKSTKPNTKGHTNQKRRTLANFATPK